MSIQTCIMFLCFFLALPRPGECILKTYVPAVYVSMAKGIMEEMSKVLPKKYGMEVVSTTAGLARSVNVLGLGFQIDGPLTKEQLREILVNCEEEFLARVNQNENIRPYLKNYPFTSENIELDIYVQDSQTGLEAVDPNISVASISNGCVVYCSEFKDPKTPGYKSKEVESYEDALRIVKEGRSS